MGEEPLHERMKRYEELSAQVSETERKRDAVGRTVQNRLASVITEAVAEQGANVEAAERSDDGRQYRFEARLDRAALVAAVTEELPDGFVVEHVNEDGSLSIEWVGKRETPSKRDNGAVLKAIVLEEMVTDHNGLIESAPTRERVIERAVELGLDEDEATARLDRLATLRVVDVSDGEVLPGNSFSRF